MEKMKKGFAMKEKILEIRNLHASIEGKQILNGVNLTINKGEIHALMGPNGSGKSTLSNIIMGHPKYNVSKGEILFNGENILELKPTDRAKKGLFLSFQYPLEIPGVKVSSFLWTAYRAQHPETKMTLLEFHRMLKEKQKVLSLSDEFSARDLNVGFSGGEKKRAEILQLLVLQPPMAILDETDSGLDIDSLKLVANAIDDLRGPEFSSLIITHYKRILNYVKPDFVHVLVDGKITMSGGHELAEQLEEKGYGWITKDEVAVKI